MELAVTIVSWRIDSPGVGTEMGPYYASMCTELGWAPDADLLASFTCVVHLALAMDVFLLGFSVGFSLGFTWVLCGAFRAANEKELKEKTDAIEDATQNFGEAEVLDAIIALADFHARIGNKVL